MGLALRDAQATADPALSPCYSAYFENFLFPYGSSSLFALVAVSALVGAVLLIIRRRQFRHVWARGLLLVLVACAAGEHVAIGLVHALYGMAHANVTYERLQDCFFGALNLSICCISLNLCLFSPKSWWKTLAIASMALVCSGAVAVLTMLIFFFEITQIRFVWLATDVATVLSLIFAVQAASRTLKHQRELALLNAAAAAFIIRSIPEILVLSTLVYLNITHLDASTNALYEIFLELIPTIVLLMLMWPRPIILVTTSFDLLFV